MSKAHNDIQFGIELKMIMVVDTSLHSLKQLSLISVDSLDITSKA